MKPVVISAIFFLITGCGGTPDPTGFTVESMDRDTLSVPDGCEHYYDHENKIVAVTEFANLTTYGDGVSVSGISRGSYRQSYNDFNVIAKDVAPQLGEFAQTAVESTLVNLGGVTIVSRSQIEQILNEQMFQMTIADPDTIVDFGRLMGAQIIITGSVDNIKVTYTTPVNTDYDANVLGLILTVGSLAYNAVSSGWNVETAITLNVIDVSTGEVLASNRANSSVNIGDAAAFTYDQVIAGAKSAIDGAVKSSIGFMIENFEVKTYINELRGNKKLALLNVGRSQGIQEGDKLQVLDMTNQVDFRTNNARCVVTPMDITLVVTPHVQEDYAWAVIKGDKKKLEKVKVGSVVKRVQAKR